MPLADCVASEKAITDGSDNKYFKRLNEWTQKGNSFTTDFTVPFAWANRQVLFRLGWASADYEIRVNGEAVAYNSDCNAPAEFNLTRHAKEGRNTLEVSLSSPSKVERLESWKNDASPAIGAAWVMSQPTLRVRDILTKTWRSTEEGDNVMAEVGLVVKSEALNPRTSRVHYELLSPAGKTSATGYKDIKLNMRGEDTGPGRSLSVLYPCPRKAAISSAEAWAGTSRVRSVTGVPFTANCPFCTSTVRNPSGTSIYSM